MARINPTTPGMQQIQQPDRREFTPIDTLVTAPQPTSIQDNDFYQFAQGLAKVSPELQKYALQSQEVQAKTDTAAARADQIKTGLTYAEGVRRGVIPPDKSPFYVAGYNEIDGKNAAYEAGESVTENLKSDPIINNPDPNAVHQWVGQKMKDYVASLPPEQQNNPAFMAAFSQHADPYYGKAAALHSQASSANAVGAMTDALGTRFSQIIDDSYVNAKPGSSPDPAALSSALHQATSLPAFAGVKPEIVQNLMAQALQNKALAEKDPDIMQALVQPRPDRLNPQNPGAMIPGFGNTVQGKAFIQSTQDHIDASIARDNAQQHVQDEQARQATERSWQQKVTAEFLQTHTVSPQTLLAANAAGASDVVSKAQSLIENGRKVNDYVAPAQYASAMTDLQMGRFGNDADGNPITDPLHAALQMVKDHRIPGQDTDKFMNEATGIQNTGLYKNADYKRVIGQISGEIPDPIMGKIFLTPGVQAQATNEFATNVSLEMKKLQAGGQAADPQAVSQMIYQQQQAIVSKYQAMNKAGADATPAAPAQPALPQSSVSSSGTPKLESAAPADIAKVRALLSNPGADTNTIKSDLKNKYSDAALARFFPFLK